MLRLLVRNKEQLFNKEEIYKDPNLLEAVYSIKVFREELMVEKLKELVKAFLNDNVKELMPKGVEL